MKNRIFIIKLIISLLVTYLTNSATAQKSPIDGPQFVKSSGEVKIIDSQYYLIANIFITNNESIEVKKIRTYEESFPNSASRLFIQKIIRGLPVNISVTALKQPIFYADYDKLEKIDKSHPLKDTILLDNEIPFEIGSYLISFEIVTSSPKTDPF